jgi:hypothetical protein
MRQTGVAAMIAYAAACHSSHGSGPHDAAVDAEIDAEIDAAPDAATNPAGTIGRYEAEDQMLVGSAAIVGAADLSSRSQGDLGGEASVRRAVTLSNAGDGISFAVLPANAGANAIVVRYSLPDLPTGGGQTAPLALTVTAPDNTPLVTETLTLTSRYAWGYGSVAAGTKIYNVPANAVTNDGSDLAIHIYDETQLLLASPLPAGATVALTAPAATPPVTLDFVELEIAPPPLAQPAGMLSITDAACGAIPLDTRGTGRAFDGADDSSYASVFDAVAGINPFNPTGSNGVQSAGTQEKDYYTNGSADVLQDGSASAASANLSMFALADHNAQSIATCLTTVAAAGSAYTGVWIPPGRFYVRGTVVVPSGATIRGAGIWYAKLVAVDTAPPEPATNPATGLSGIASVSGDLRFIAGSGGTADATISDLALFGNVTQRDVVDRFTPIGVDGAFSTSTFERIWIEHYSQGVVMNGSANGDTISELRVRGTLADGIDLFGDTSNTTISNSKTRGTGDDGFAVWSQSATTVSTGNLVTGDLAELPWFGDGFGVYGGTKATLTDDTAIDTLSGAGYKLATTFVAPSLPSTFVMTDVFVSNGTLVRCGGNAFAQHTGALQIGPELESIAGMIVDRMTIEDPTFAAVDIRVISSIGPVASPGSVGVALANIEVLGAGSAGCATVGAQMTGSATLDAACACAAVGSAATTCTGSNASPATFAVEVACPEVSCP